MGEAAGLRNIDMRASASRVLLLPLASTGGVAVGMAGMGVGIDGGADRCTTANCLAEEEVVFSGEGRSGSAGEAASLGAGGVGSTASG
jgi:hypothetical protein